MAKAKIEYEIFNRAEDEVLRDAIFKADSYVRRLPASLTSWDRTTTEDAFEWDPDEYREAVREIR
jgi:hypothetical protein